MPAASPQGSFLLVSTDPAHSLADSLGDFQPPANLQILEFNAQDSLETFKAKHRGKFAEIAARGTFLDEEDIRRILDLSLPGLDELMPLLEIAGWVETRAYDLIVVDTAPTGHTLRLLATPELIRTWLKALDALLAKHRFMQQRFRGSYQPDELDDFLLDLAAAVKQPGGSAAESPHLPLCAGDAGGRPGHQRDHEAPGRTAASADPGQGGGGQPPLSGEFLPPLRRRTAAATAAPRRAFNGNALGRLCLVGRAPWARKKCGGPLLETFWDGVTRLDLAQPPLLQAPLEIPPRVEAAPPCPPPELNFLIFAGKGGVGKTTLACATAVRLAQEFPDKQILLFSTDPAHSLAACLEVAPGLPAGAPRPGPLGHGDRRPG